MSEKDQRATLEAKDRDELLTIASTLGGKPGSRAKKAEVIDLILGLIADSEPAPPKPRRGRPPKAAVVEEAPVDEEDEEIEEVVAIDEEAASDDAADHADDGDVGDETSGASADDGASRPSGETDTDGDDGEGGSRRRRRRGRDRGGERFEARTDEPWSGDPVEVSGVLDLRDEGYGFIRVSGYLPTRDDVTCRSNKPASSRFVVATSSSEQVALPLVTKRTRRCFALTLSMGERPIRLAIVVDSTTSHRCSPTSASRFHRVMSRTT